MNKFPVITRPAAGYENYKKIKQTKKNKYY